MKSGELERSPLKETRGMWDGEVFQKLHTDERLLLRLAGDPFRFLALRSRRATSIYGFELKVNPGAHLDRPPFSCSVEFLVRELHRHNYSVIYLNRSNHLRWLVSVMSAHLTKRYHTTETGSVDRIELPLGSHPLYKGERTLANFLDLVIERDRTIRQALNTLPNHLALEFESHVTPDVNVAASMVLHLVDPISEFTPVASTLVPTVGGLRLEEVIRNYADLATHLRDTEHGRFLD